MRDQGRKQVLFYGFACGLALASLAGCARLESPAEQYREARRLMNYGSYTEAARVSKNAQNRMPSRVADDGWRAAFRVLDAELLGRSGNAADAVPALNAIQPPAGRPEIRARRNAELANQLCIQAPTRGSNAPALFRQAEQLLDDAIATAASADAEVQAEARIRRVSCLMRQRRATEAEAELRSLIDFTRANRLDFLQASALVTLASLRWSARRPEEGLPYATEALAIGKRIGAGSVILKSLGNLGLCYTSIGDYDRALDIYRQADSVPPEPGLRDDQRVLLTNTGNIHYYLDDYAAAAGYYRRALELARQLRKDDSVALLLGNLGETAIKQNDIDGAKRFNRDALEIKRKLDNPASLQRSLLLEARILEVEGDLEASRSAFQALLTTDAPEDVLWAAHSRLATVYKRMARPADAEREHRAAVAAAENSRAAFKLDDSKIAFQSTISDLYSDYIGFLAEGGRARDAWLIADRSRATTLAQRMSLQPERSSEDPVRLAAACRSVLLSYWLSENESYLWVATGNSIEQFRLPAAREIEAAVERYQRVIETPRDAMRDAEDEGIKLWRMLIGPAAKKIPQGSHVVVVADRALHLLNFETLIAPEPIPHYWIEDVTIREAPSFASLSADTGSPGPDNILVMGDPAQASREFPPLASSSGEVAAIAGLFPSSDRVVLTEASATPSAYVDSTPGKFRYIHLSAHATANRISPLDSAVVLAKSGDDFRLYARAVAKVPLGAELVTVSACRSAGSRAYAGEGLVGFAWAFLGAGARNVIAGLWKVEDASTAQLIVQLYRELRLGRPPADALRDAKLGLLRSGTAYRRPFYWAPFLLYTRVR